MNLRVSSLKAFISGVDMFSCAQLSAFLVRLLIKQNFSYGLFQQFFHTAIFVVSRHSGEDNKMLVCDTCDKGYHTFCLQPVMDSVPTNGWKCKVS